MSVELPKDAEGREIPLDTVALYDESGNVYSIRRFIYTNDFDLNDKWMNSWYVVADDYKTAKPEQMYLTLPDSWKALEEDLAKAATDNGNDAECNYFGLPNCTKECPAWDRCCSVAFADNILSRIRKLRGED